MIDGFKCWNAKTNLEIESINLKGLRISKTKHGGFVIDGSLHKFAKEGLHNANDYSLSDFKNTLNKLFEDLGLNPEITIVNGFEFGVNIKLPYSPNNVLKHLILHKSSSGLTDKVGKRFEYQTYSVKLYNKSMQCKIEPYQSENILRIEVKVSKMEFLKKKSVHCHVLSDLLDVSVWKSFESILIETINDLLIIDLSETEEKELSDKERIKYLEYNNPLFWGNLYNGTRENRSKYGRERAKCDSFINQHSNSTLKAYLLTLIATKCKELRDEFKANDIIKKWDKLTVLPTDNKNGKCDKLSFLPRTKLKEECNKLPIKMNEYFVPVEYTEKVNIFRCKGCGKIILHPSRGQLFCSAKEVGYRRAHKCRDMASNAKKSIRRILSNPLLFDLTETIAPDKRKYLKYEVDSIE